MPESKRIFQRGRMNLDLDDRLVPNGEYRWALNVNIGRSEGSDVGAVENLLGNQIITNGNGVPQGSCIGVYRDNGNERIYFFVTNNNSIDESNADNHAVFEYDQTSNVINRLAFGSWLNFHTNFLISGINFVDGLLFWTDNRNEPRKIEVDRARQDDTYYNSDDRASVIKFHPYLAPTIFNVSTATRVDDQGDPLPRSNFLRNRLIRFSYRYKFEDGELSTLAPYSTTCFATRRGDLTTGDLGSGNIVNAGEIIDFVNDIQEITIRVPIPSRDLGITSVELIWKEQSSTTNYIIEEKELSGDSLEFVYTAQDPFRALPPSQTTRVSDAVPRRALSQEFAGGRLIYGNFLHQFNLPRINFDVDVTQDSSARHPQFPRYSLKSRRNYQVGIVLADKFGRQTPVILSSSGNDTIFIDAQSGDADSVFQALQVTINNIDEIRSVAPWAYSYKIYVKQREQEYYNWFAGGGSVRTGDSVNKIPVDTTQGTTGTNLPSTASVYPKVTTGGANDTSDNLLALQSIDTAGQTATVVGGSAAVYETDPVESQLDIFFETSTSGLIPEMGSIQPINVDYFNCFLANVDTTAHIELNRIRAGFNEAWFDFGVRASLVVEEYAEERRFNTLIHSSSFFNSRTGINNVNQFNVDEGGLTVSLDPSDGSIQKLYAEDTQLIIWQEDKVSRSPIDKDFIYSAEGGAVPVTSNSQYLGTIAPYAGEYGISKNPTSFAVYGTRKYFTDKNRGVVLRLSQDGLTEISKQGMSDFFRDVLRTSTKIVGSFDEYHDTYNLTIRGNNYRANTDTNFATGATDGYFTGSFEEDVQGWSAFKSFRQEAGTTLNNLYYTFSGGDLWVHNSDAVDRNNFYGVQGQSEVEMVFNDAPSVVKEFKTLGYEGSGTWDCDVFMTDYENITPEANRQVSIETVTAQLQEDPASIITNARIVGLGPRTVESGQVARWIIYAEPISSLFTFTEAERASATIAPVAGLNIGDPVLNEAERRIYWNIVSDPLTAGPVVKLLNFDVDAVSSVIGDFVDIRFREQSSLYNLTSLFIGLSDGDFNNALNNEPAVTLTLRTREENDDLTDNLWYFENTDDAALPDISALPVAGTPPAAYTLTENTNSSRRLKQFESNFIDNDLVYTFNINRPAVPDSYTVFISNAMDNLSRASEVVFQPRFAVDDVTTLSQINVSATGGALDNRQPLYIGHTGGTVNLPSTVNRIMDITPRNGRVFTSITDPMNRLLYAGEDTFVPLPSPDPQFGREIVAGASYNSTDVATTQQFLPQNGLRSGSIRYTTTHSFAASSEDPNVGLDNDFYLVLQARTEAITLATDVASVTLTDNTARSADFTIMSNSDFTAATGTLFGATGNANFPGVSFNEVDPVYTPDVNGTRTDATLTINVPANTTGAQRSGTFIVYVDSTRQTGVTSNTQFQTTVTVIQPA